VNAHTGKCEVNNYRIYVIPAIVLHRVTIIESAERNLRRAMNILIEARHCPPARSSGEGMDSATRSLSRPAAPAFDPAVRSWLRGPTGRSFSKTGRFPSDTLGAAIDRPTFRRYRIENFACSIFPHPEDRQVEFDFVPIRGSIAIHRTNA